MHACRLLLLAVVRPTSEVVNEELGRRRERSAYCVMMNMRVLYSHVMWECPVCNVICRSFSGKDWNVFRAGVVLKKIHLCVG